MAKKILLLVVVILLAAGVVFGLPYLDRWYNEVEVTDDIIHGDKVEMPGRIATIYFSRVGNTDFPADVDAVSGASVMRNGNEILGNAQMIAMMVNDAVGGDICEIQTVDKYPAVYKTTTEVAKQEFEGEITPRLKELPLKVSDYDTIILVYPLWWSTLPKPVEIFLATNDFSNKTIIPIVTHGGGGTGDSVTVIKRTVNATVREPLDIYSSDISSARKVISDYLVQN